MDQYIDSNFGKHGKLGNHSESPLRQTWNFEFIETWRIVQPSDSLSEGKCKASNVIQFGGFHKWGYPPMDGL